MSKVSPDALSINNIVAQPKIDYQYEWESRIAREWYEDYFVKSRDLSEVECEVSVDEFNSVTQIIFTFKVNNESVNAFVYVDMEGDILEISELMQVGISKDRILEEIYHIDKRWNQFKEDAVKTFQVLKFIPRTYRIEIRGSIEDINVGEITKQQFEYWNTDVNRYILDKLVHRDDDIGEDDFEEMDGLDQVPGIFDIDSLYELDIPDDIKLFDEYWGENNNLWGSLGACFWDEYSEVVVYDENGICVWNSKLNPIALTQMGIPFVLDEEFNTKDIKTVTYVFSGSDGEAGILCRGDILLNDDFDPTKLEFHYDRFDGNDYIDQVFYRTEEIVMGDNDSCPVGGSLQWALYQKQDEDDEL